MFAIFNKLMSNEDGATAIEYGLIAALISVAAITAFSTVGTKLSALMTSVSTKLQ
jgi:pilus assembly protein Flp/PilA